jgi:hypothetical protein
VIVEMKIRDSHYPTLILESKKYHSLMKLKKKELEVFPKVSVLYINATPKSTYLFNLDKVDIKWEIGKFNKTTVHSRTHKINKKITYLNVDEAIDLKVVFDRNKKSKEVKEKMKSQRAQRCIFKSVDKLKE